MAITPNGFIAKPDDNTDWISIEEWDTYSRMVRDSGNLIVGHRTYNILTKQPGFSEFKDVTVVVVGSEPIQLLSVNHKVTHSPQEAINLFKSGEKIIVAGGSILNASFLEKNLIDEIYLDIEPIIFGKGIPIFHNKQFEAQLELLGIKNISKNELQLHYKIVKP